MRLLFTASCGLLVGFVAANSAQLDQRDECIEDALYNCFTSSLVQASAYCTRSIVTVTETTNTVIVTPTVTLVEDVTETAEAATVTATSIEHIAKRSRPRKRRGACVAKPPACLANLPSAVQEAQFTSACSCIGITTTTHLATVTASTPETVLETLTVTDTPTVTVWVPEFPESTETSIIETSTTSVPETSTAAPIETSTIETSTTSVPETSTAAPTPSVAPAIENGGFETGSLAPWVISSRVGSGDVVSVIKSTAPNGGSYMLSILTSYFIRNAAASVTISQPITCDVGSEYSVSLQVAIVSSYTNGNAWSIVAGAKTVVSGAGSAVAWNNVVFVHTCGATAAANTLSLKMQSSNSRQATMLVDNVVIVPKV